MLSWVTKTAQSTLASVAGTAEPIYGPEALHSVAVQEHENPTYEVTPEDLQWHVLDSTCAETKIFYFETEGGHSVMVQVIYSNVVGLHVSTQVNVKVFYPDGKIHWSAKTVGNFGFDEHNRSLKGDDFSIILADSNDSFTVKSELDPETLIDLKFTRAARGFMVGKDGKTNYGEEPDAPWGCIKHLFWPKCHAEGELTVKGEVLSVAGTAMFVMALQGMKPHHAAAKWNFVTFQSPNVSAMMMDFTTPPSYGSQTVNVSGILKDDDLLLAGTQGVVEHVESKFDQLTEWMEPTVLRAVWKGKSPDGKEAEAMLETPLDQRMDRVDVMAEVPAIIKKLVAGAVGTRPYIYQYKKPVTLKLKIGDEVTEEEGTLFSEATFIC